MLWVCRQVNCRDLSSSSGLRLGTVSTKIFGWIWQDFNTDLDNLMVAWYDKYENLSYKTNPCWQVWWTSLLLNHSCNWSFKSRTIEKLTCTAKTLSVLRSQPFSSVVDTILSITFMYSPFWVWIVAPVVIPTSWPGTALNVNLLKTTAQGHDSFHESKTGLQRISWGHHWMEYICAFSDCEKAMQRWLLQILATTHNQKSQVILYIVARMGDKQSRTFSGCQPTHWLELLAKALQDLQI